jgi:DNA-directed RNA polymerase
MSAENPWEFLASCIELRNARLFQELNGEETPYSFESGLIGFIDGSNNGSQHLAALTLDENTAPLVNLTPSSLPGDLYQHVSTKVWENIEDRVSRFPPALVTRLSDFLASVVSLKKEIRNSTVGSEEYKNLITSIQKLKKDEEALMGDTGVLFWSRIVDPKHRRKIVKRNVMTLPYGGTSYGLGQQQIDDARKHGIEDLLYMEHKWGAYMGQEVYRSCLQSLVKPMMLLSLFEQIGKSAEDRGEFLKWTTPIVNAPVEQHYVEGTVRMNWVHYGPHWGDKQKSGYYKNAFQLHICFIEDTKPSKGRQAQGASPNIIHSLDATHLTMVVCASPFDVVTIHDSFGASLADMADLFCIVREQFVELYKQDPLHLLLTQFGMEDNVPRGKLDINQIIESEFAFA